MRPLYPTMLMENALSAGRLLWQVLARPGRGREACLPCADVPATGASLRGVGNMLSVAHEPRTERDRHVSRHSPAGDAARAGNIDHHHRPDRRHGRGGSRLQDRVRGARFHFLPAQGRIGAGRLRPLRPVLPQSRHRLVLGRVAAARHPAAREMGRCQRPHQARPHQPARLAGARRCAGEEALRAAGRLAGFRSQPLHLDAADRPQPRLLRLRHRRVRQRPPRQGELGVAAGPTRQRPHRAGRRAGDRHLRRRPGRRSVRRGHLRGHRQSQRARDRRADGFPRGQAAARLLPVAVARLRRCASSGDRRTHLRPEHVVAGLLGPWRCRPAFRRGGADRGLPRLARRHQPQPSSERPPPRHGL